MSIKQSRKAGVPLVGYRSSGSLYDGYEAQDQEKNHTTLLSIPEFCTPICDKLERFIECMYNAEKDTKCILKSTALQFTCLLKVEERSLEVSNLVCCGKAVKFKLLEMTLSCLINLCKNWGEAPLSLSILNPIPPVRRALKFTWVPWSSTHDDPFLPSDRIEDSMESIPVELKNTGCCPISCEVHERWGVHPPELDPQEVCTIEDSICEDYLKSLECMFYRINLAFEVKSRHKTTFTTDAACVVIKFSRNGKKAILTYISVRPCLQGLKIAHMILYVLMDACVRFNIEEFYVEETYPSSVSILKKLGGFKVSREYCYDNNYKINFENMFHKTLIACGLKGMLAEHKDHRGYFIITQSFFPTSEELNNQEAVNDRFAKKQRTLEEAGAAGV